MRSASAASRADRSAAGIIMLLPMMGLFLLLQRHFIAGIASGGLGGG